MLLSLRSVVFKHMREETGYSIVYILVHLPKSVFLYLKHYNVTRWRHSVTWTRRGWFIYATQYLVIV